MPHFWNDMVVVTKDELVPEWYNSDNNLYVEIQRYKKRSHGIKRVQKGGNGREMLINFDTLTIEIQLALGDPRKNNHPLERYYRFDGEANYFYNTYKFEDYTYLSMEHQAKYAINASVLRAVITMIEAQRVAKPENKIDTTPCQWAASFNETLRVKLKSDMHTLPESEKHFKRVLKAFEANNYVSLISAKHKNVNSRKVTDETLSLINNMFAGVSTKPSPTQVYKKYDLFINGHLEVINNGTGECYNPADFKSLSDATVKRYLAMWANKIGNYAKRSGDRQQYMGQFRPYHSFGKSNYSGSLLSIDDRQPPFKTPDGKRIWFYNGWDSASHAFTCWVHGTSKEGIIIKFYQQLVRNYYEWGFNLPAELEAEMSLNSSYTDTFLRAGAMFQYVHIEANNARGKRIERENKVLRYELEKELEGFIPRPFAKLESNQPAPKEPKVLAYDTIVEQCLQAIEDYNNRPHPVDKTISRWDYFTRNQHPDLKPTNYVAFMQYIGYRTPTSCRTGIVKCERQEFLLGLNGRVALGERLINLMIQVEGEDLDVYWLDDNYGHIFKALIFRGSQYICEAIAKPVTNRAKIDQTDEDRENFKLMAAYVATIDSFSRKQSRSIEQVTLIDNTPKVKKSFIMPGLKSSPHQLRESHEVPEILPEPTKQTNEILQSWSRPLADRY